MRYLLKILIWSTCWDYIRSCELLDFISLEKDVTKPSSALVTLSKHLQRLVWISICKNLKMSPFSAMYIRFLKHCGLSNSFGLNFSSSAKNVRSLRAWRMFLSQLDFNWSQMIPIRLFSFMYYRIFLKFELIKLDSQSEVANHRTFSFILSSLLGSQQIPKIFVNSS